MVSEVVCILIHRKPAGNLNHLPLPHPKHQYISRCICKDGLAYRIRPVVIVSEPPQAGLDAAKYDWSTRKNGMQLISVHDGGTVGS